MAFPELRATKREPSVRARHLRSDGFIPCELYGSGSDNLSLKVAHSDFSKFFTTHGDSGIVQLLSGEKGAENVIFQDIQRHPLTGDVLHVDLLRIRMDAKMIMDVPLVYTGISPAIKELGGVLVKNMAELEVECLPKDLPKQIEVDISSLKEFDDTVVAGQLPLPSGVEICEDASDVVAVVIAPRSEEELAQLDEEVTEDVETVAGVEEKPEEEAPEEEAEKEAEEKPEKEEEVKKE